MGEELIPDGLRKLTEKVYDVLVPGVGKNETYVFTVSGGLNGDPWVHGFHAGEGGVNVKVSAKGNVSVTPETTHCTLAYKPQRPSRNTVDINGMWTALQCTQVFKCLYNLNCASEEYDGGRFYDNPYFGVDMYVPGGMGGTVADTLFLCLAWGYLYSLPPEDDGKTVAINVAELHELAPAGTEIPVAMSNVEGSTARAGFEYLTQELRDRGVFCRNKTLNDFLGFKFSGF